MGMELGSIDSIMEQWIWLNPFASPTDHSSGKESHSEEMDKGKNSNIILTISTETYFIRRMWPSTMFV